MNRVFQWPFWHYPGLTDIWVNGSCLFSTFLIWFLFVFVFHTPRCLPAMYEFFFHLWHSRAQAIQARDHQIPATDVKSWIIFEIQPKKIIIIACVWRAEFLLYFIKVYYLEIPLFIVNKPPTNEPNFIAICFAQQPVCCILFSIFFKICYTAIKICVCLRVACRCHDSASFFGSSHIHQVLPPLTPLS